MIYLYNILILSPLIFYVIFIYRSIQTHRKIRADIKKTNEYLDLLKSVNEFWEDINNVNRYSHQYDLYRSLVLDIISHPFDTQNQESINKNLYQIHKNIIPEIIQKERELKLNQLI